MVLRTERSAGYAALSRAMDSSSGVIVGRESRQGRMASSKTEERLVRRRMSDLLPLMGMSRSDARRQPRILKGRLSSSISVKMAGTRRGKCASRWSRSVACGFVGHLYKAGLWMWTNLILGDDP